MPKINEKNIWRVIDANYNRAKEGLRVCEDVCRFVLKDTRLTESFKKFRHDMTKYLQFVSLDNIVKSRNSREDVGKATIDSELKRDDVKDIFYANIQRVKESVRVLEEIAKIYRAGSSKDFKRMRYRIYEVEKRIIERC